MFICTTLTYLLPFYLSLSTLESLILFILQFYLKALGAEGIGAFNLHVKKKSSNKNQKTPIIGKDCHGLLWNEEGKK